MEDRKIGRNCLSGAAFVLAGFGFLSLDAAQAQDAEPEDSVVFYSAAPAGVLDDVTKAFTEKYPDIEAQYYRGNSAQVLQRVMSDSQSGRVQVDVVHVSDPATREDIKKAGYHQPHKAPAFQNYGPKNDK